MTAKTYYREKQRIKANSKLKQPQKNTKLINLWFDYVHTTTQVQKISITA